MLQKLLVSKEIFHDIGEKSRVIRGHETALTRQIPEEYPCFQCFYF